MATTIANVSTADHVGRFLNEVTEVLALAAAAFRCAAAVESGRRPDQADLATLGIPNVMQPASLLGR